MQQKKLVHELSDDELLNLAAIEQPKTEAAPQYSYDNVEGFLALHNLRPGTKRVSKYHLYQFYKLTVSQPIPKTAFTMRLIELLGDEHITKNGYVKLASIPVTLAVYKKPKIRKENLKVYQVHFERFLAENNISAGKVLIMSTDIRDIYTKWCLSKYKKIKLGRYNLIKFLDIYFEKKTTSQQRAYYKINRDLKEGINQHDEAAETIKEERKET